MATFIEVQDRINNEFLNRTTFLQETKTAIKAAIRHYERKRWTFNESSVELASSAGGISVALPDNFLILDNLVITSAGIDYDLNVRSLSYIRRMNARDIQGLPTDYCLYARALQLAPIPDAIYAMPLDYIKQLPALSADDDTNPFLEGNFGDAITYHAAKLVWGVSLRNDAEASKFASLEQLAMLEVKEHFIEQFSGKIEPTEF